MPTQNILRDRVDSFATEFALAKIDNKTKVRILDSLDEVRDELQRGIDALAEVARLNDRIQTEMMSVTIFPQTMASDLVFHAKRAEKAMINADFLFGACEVEFEQHN